MSQSSDVGCIMESKRIIKPRETNMYRIIDSTVKFFGSSHCFKICLNIQSEYLHISYKINRSVRKSCVDEFALYVRLQQHLNIKCIRLDLLMSCWYSSPEG